MKTKVKATAQTVELNFNYTIEDEKKEIQVILNQPNWDVTVEAFKYLYDTNDKLDLITPGKLIFDMCAIEYSDELNTNIQLLMSICSQLSTKFTLPINAQIADKKKDIDLVEKS